MEDQLASITAQKEAIVQKITDLETRVAQIESRRSALEAEQRAITTLFDTFGEDWNNATDKNQLILSRPDLADKIEKFGKCSLERLISKEKDLMADKNNLQVEKNYLLASKNNLEVKENKLQADLEELTRKRRRTEMDIVPISIYNGLLLSARVCSSSLASSNWFSFVSLPMPRSCYYPRYLRCVTALVNRVETQDIEIPREFKLNAHAPQHAMCSRWTILKPSSPEELYSRPNLNRIFTYMAALANNFCGEERFIVNSGADLVAHGSFFTFASNTSLPEPALCLQQNGHSIGLVASEGKAVGASLIDCACQGVHFSAECCFRLKTQFGRDMSVPVIFCSDGDAIQFGFVFLIHGEIPCAHMLSAPLSLLAFKDREEIQLWLAAIVMHCVDFSRSDPRPLQVPSPIRSQPTFKLERAFIKPIVTHDDSRTSLPCAMACAVALLEIFERLWMCTSARNVVCFPTGWLGYPSGATQSALLAAIKAKLDWLDKRKNTGSPFYSLLRFGAGYPLLCFPDLSLDGWTSAEEWFAFQCPERREQNIPLFLRKFRAALNAVYAAGVVLTDARLANVMVRDRRREIGEDTKQGGESEKEDTEEEEDLLELLLIDFDEAVVAGEKISEYIRNAMFRDSRYPHDDTFDYAIPEYHDFFVQLAEKKLRDPTRL